MIRDRPSRRPTLVADTALVLAAIGAIPAMVVGVVGVFVGAVPSYSEEWYGGPLIALGFLLSVGAGLSSVLRGSALGAILVATPALFVVLASVLGGGDAPMWAAPYATPFVVAGLVIVFATEHGSRNAGRDDPARDRERTRLPASGAGSAATPVDDASRPSPEPGPVRRIAGRDPIEPPPGIGMTDVPSGTDAADPASTRLAE
ncbi:MAG TPA: hypothetical protein VFS72_09540 [Agromyces sp.]|nr:hypothetical protein [Agromyces sp.]